MSRRTYSSSTSARTLVLLKALRHSDFIEDLHLLDDLVIQLQNILAADICRSVTFQQFELRPYREQIVEDGLLLGVQRDPR